MNKFIVFPIVMTNKIDGYSALAIEYTEQNLAEIQRLMKVYFATLSIDKNITEISYETIPVEIILFNNKFEFDDVPKVIELDDTDLIKYSIEYEGNELDDPIVYFSHYEMRVVFNASESASEVYSNIKYLQIQNVKLETSIELE